MGEVLGSHVDVVHEPRVVGRVELELYDLLGRRVVDGGFHLVGSGIKEKYIFQKMGIPFRQMHSWDYSGPYHGYAV